MTHHLDMFMSGKNVELNGLMFCGKKKSGFFDEQEVQKNSFYLNENVL